MGDVANLAITSPKMAMDIAGANPMAAAMENIKRSPNSVKVAKEFEAAFLGQMLQPMFTATDAEAPFGGGQAESTYRPMLINEYANALSKRGGIGVADAVLREMVRMQMAQGQIPGPAPDGAPLPAADPNGASSAAPAATISATEKTETANGAAR